MGSDLSSLRARRWVVGAVVLWAGAIAIVACTESADGGDFADQASTVEWKPGDGAFELIKCGQGAVVPCKGFGPLTLATLDFASNDPELVGESVDLLVNLQGEISDSQYNAVSLKAEEASFRFVGATPPMAATLTLVAKAKVAVVLKTDIDGRTYTYSTRPRASITNAKVTAVPATATLDTWRSRAHTIAQDIGPLRDAYRAAIYFQNLASRDAESFASLQKDIAVDIDKVLVTARVAFRMVDLTYPETDPTPSRRGALKPDAEMPEGWALLKLTNRTLSDLILLYGKVRAARYGQTEGDASTTTIADEAVRDAKRALDARVADGTALLKVFDKWNAKYADALKDARAELDRSLTTADAGTDANAP